MRHGHSRPHEILLGLLVTALIVLACGDPPAPQPQPPQNVRVTDVSPDAAYGESGGGSEQGGQIDAIAVDPTNANVVYAAGETSGVWKSSDGGHNWVHASQGLLWGATARFGPALAVNATNPQRL